MRYALLFGALVLVAIAAAQLGSSSATTRSAPAPMAAKPLAPVRPSQPPVAGRDEPQPALDEPSIPVPTEEMRAEIAEKAQGAPDPGMTAFRTFSDLYVDSNLDFARRQAEAQGITLEEVRELTHFGLLVLATQRTPEVEELLGKPLSDEQQEKMAALMTSANDGFKRDMRLLVARRASEAERWNLIKATQARYLAEYYAATGMTEALLDDLLAGNMMLPGAPINTEPPDEPVSPPDPVDDPVAPPRPR